MTVAKRSSQGASSVRGVLFDFYGTLARAVSWGDTHEAIFARHGLHFDETQWTDRWVGGTVDGEDHGHHSISRDHYLAFEHARLRSRVVAAGIDEVFCAALVPDLYKASKDYTLAAYDEVADELAGLRSADVMVAICSNWDWDLDDAVASVGLSHLVDVTVTSAQAGARKPHPRIYNHALERCGLKPEQVLFVGDTWGPDVVGPLAAGMKAVHLYRNDRNDHSNPQARPALPPGSTRRPDLGGLARDLGFG